MNSQESSDVQNEIFLFIISSCQPFYASILDNLFHSYIDGLRNSIDRCKQYLKFTKLHIYLSIQFLNTINQPSHYNAAVICN